MIPDARTLAGHLAAGAALFRFMDAPRARAAMEGRLESDGTLAARFGSFDEAVAARLEELRALNRRRDALRGRTDTQSA